MKLQAVPSLSCKGYSIFHNTILTAIATDTREALLQSIQADREGKAGLEEREMIKQVGWFKAEGVLFFILFEQAGGVLALHARFF